LRSLPAFTAPEYYDKKFKEYLKSVDNEIVAFVSLGLQPINAAISKNSSHKIALMEPDAEGTGYKATLTSRYIAHRMASATEANSQRHFYEFFKQISRQPELRTGAGWFFEAYAHDWFRKGGKFEADELPLKETNPKMTISTMRSDLFNYFTTPTDLAKQVTTRNGVCRIDPSMFGKYFQPYAKSQASFDGLVFNQDGTVLILLQYTLAERHEIKERGVKELLDKLPAVIKSVYIVFVVPRDRAIHYSKLQKSPDAAALGWRGEIKQYRLVFTDDDIKKVAVNQNPSMPGEGWDKGGEGGAGDIVMSGQ
jgi:hypothetical protein